MRAGARMSVQSAQTSIVRRSGATFGLSTDSRWQSCVLQSMAQLVVVRDAPKIFFEPETVKYVRDTAEGHARVSALDRAQRGPRHPRAFGDEPSRESAALSRQTDALPERHEHPGD